MNRREMTISKAREKLHRISTIRLWLVCSVLVACILLGVFFCIFFEAFPAGFLIGTVIGLFLSWMIGLGFENIEYPLKGIIRDQNGNLKLEKQKSDSV
jgi:F0F1-type ATP synthase assembly protein I